MFKWFRGFVSGVFGLSFVILTYILWMYMEADKKRRERSKESERTNYWGSYWKEKGAKE